MKNFLKEYGYAIWLGAALGVIGFGPFDWQTYFVLLPTCALVDWKSK